MKYTVLILYRATNLWLSLTREEHSLVFKKEIVPLLFKFQDKIKVSLFDSEAFHAQTSDFIIVETDDLKEYYFFMENLRDTTFFGKPYIVLNDIIIGLENGYKTFEDAAK